MGSRFHVGSNPENVHPSLNVFGELARSQIIRRHASHQNVVTAACEMKASRLNNVELLCHGGEAQPGM
jgi:hypothetical protein